MLPRGGCIGVDLLATEERGECNATVGLRDLMRDVMDAIATETDPAELVSSISQKGFLGDPDLSSQASLTFS